MVQYSRKTSLTRETLAEFQATVDHSTPNASGEKKRRRRHSHRGAVSKAKQRKAKNKKSVRIERPKFYCNKCKFETLTKSFFQKHLSAKHSENPKSSKGTKQK